MTETTTIEIEKETHMLIRQYCILNNIKVKEFIKELVNEKLKEFKKNMEKIKRNNNFH